MRFRLLAFGWLCLLAPLCPVVGVVRSDEVAQPATALADLPDPVEFNRDVRPILADSCYTCHGPDQAQRATDFRLDKEGVALAALASGEFAIVPGDVAASELSTRVHAADAESRMPPPDATRQLTAREIAILDRWIEQGAKWEKHWSFIAPQSPPLPTLKDASRVINPVDQFIIARLERDGLRLSPEASKETLLRRVTLDLTGLPPTLAEVDAFVADTAPDAYEKVVDRLLASPRYGERMMLEWLDAARYADSNGYQTDGTRAMWPWRDGVIQALNDNMPFDQFTVEQLAGDLLPEATQEQQIASGFHRNCMLNGEGGRIPEESRVEYVVDRVETTATVWMGLTMGCTRCHDHKYDPITQKEFYQFYAFFNNLSETGAVDRRNSTAAPTLELPTAEQTAAIATQTAAVAALDQQLQASAATLLAAQPAWEQTLAVDAQPAPIQEILKVAAADRTPEQQQALTAHHLASSAEHQALQKQRNDAQAALDGTRNSVLITMVMDEQPTARETFILVRGLYDNHGEKVDRGLPAVLPPLGKDAANNRLGLAQWLVSCEHPLTGRVMANRYWQMFFGTGLVKTSEDFGVQGERPSHPELLDWLATKFQQDWDVKALHRLLVTSATYRQSSHVSPALLELDPDNRLLARGPRYRWNAHVLRDQALAVSGLLVEKVGGPPVKPYQPAGIWEDFSFDQIKYEQDHGESLYRRSLYTFWRRSVAPTTMFDIAGRTVCTVRQPRTNTPLHALVLFNDVTFAEAARVFAQRILLEGGETSADKLTFGFRLVTGRHPRSEELSVLQASLERVLAEYQANPEAAKLLVSVGESPRNESLDQATHAAYSAVASVLLNMDETLNKE